MTTIRTIKVDETTEKRYVQDDNGFFREQIRVQPVEEWDPLDGWWTVRYVDYYEAKGVRQ